MRLSNSCKKISSHQNFQVVIDCQGDKILDKVYKTHAAAYKRVAKIVNDLDDGKIIIENFSHCEIQQIFS